MANKGRSIANAQGFFLKHEAEVETTEEIAFYAKEKVKIVNDFLLKKDKLGKEEKQALKKRWSALNSTRAIDVAFRNFINSHI